MAPDPSTGGGVAAIIAAAGGGVAGILGGVALLIRRRDSEDPRGDRDPENRPARLRERLTALETRVGGHDQDLEHVTDEVMLLRAQEITAEAQIPRPVRRRRT